MQIEENYSLKKHNTFGVDVKGRYFIRIDSVEKLAELLRHPIFLDHDHIVLGEGSNILFTRNYNGLVVQMALDGIHVVKEDKDFYWIKVGAGVKWHQLVVNCIRADFGGLENLSLIPGKVGAAPIQNIGAYGVEVKDYIEAVEAYDTVSGEKRYFRNEECQFAYRSSIFKKSLKNRFIITNVAFRLTKKHILNTSYGAIAKTLAAMKITEPSIASVSQAVIKIRQSKLPDPAEIGNAGSFFKNPVVPNAAYQNLQNHFKTIPGYSTDDGNTKIPAGWLIEQCGWKGKKSGNAGVHHKQALVLVNLGHATGLEILELAKKITESVQQKFDITLEPEVNII